MKNATLQVLQIKKVMDPWFIEYQHIFPIRLNDEVKIDIEKATSHIVNVLG